VVWKLPGPTATPVPRKKGHGREKLSHTEPKTKNNKGISKAELKTPAKPSGQLEHNGDARVNRPGDTAKKGMYLLNIGNAKKNASLGKPFNTDPASAERSE